MSPRYVPPKLADLGLEVVFEKRKLNLELFRLLVKSNLTDTAIAKALSEEYKEKYGIEQAVRPATVKKYRSLL